MEKVNRNTLQTGGFSRYWQSALSQFLEIVKISYQNLTILDKHL